MKKLMLFYVAFTLVLSGCGKKKEVCEDKGTCDSKELALADKGDIPLYNAENNEALLDEEAVSDFAFVDEDDNTASLNKNKKTGVVASSDSAMPMLSEDETLASHDANFERVQFDFDKSSLRADQKPVVKKDTAVAQKVVTEGKDIVIAGHTCQIGSATYNLALSQKRAEAVKAEMLKAGVPQKKIKTIGYGYEYPLVWSDKTERTEKIKELAANRRAEIATN